MSDEQDPESVIAPLSGAGVDVDTAPASTVPRARRCDPHAHDNTEHCLLEMKGIHEDDAMAPSLRTDRNCSANKLITESTTVSTIVDDAAGNEQTRRP